VRPPVDTFQQHRVDLGEQLVDRTDDFHAKVLHALCKTLDAIGARGNVRAAAGISSDHAHARQLAAGVWIIEQFRKGHDVRCIEADDADANRFGVLPAGQRAA
jgi:hypothetical protein